MKYLILALLLSACSSLPPNTEQVTLVLLTPQEIGQYCDIGALGCTEEHNGECIIYAPKPPEGSFGPYLTTSTPKEYTVIGHELLHCFSWSHE